jgi:hypothetical protein
MAAPYLEEIEQELRKGAPDLLTVAKNLNISFESVCLSFNNGLLKGYWKIVVNSLPLSRVTG